MKVGNARVVLRPRTVPEIFELALRWQATLAGPLYLKLGALLLLPSFALCLWARFGEDYDWNSVWWLALLSTLTLQGVFTVANSLLFFEENVTVSMVFRNFFYRSLGRYVGTFISCGLLLGLFNVFGDAMFAFMAAVFSIFSIYVYETCLLEEHFVFAAVRRSKCMVSGMFFNSVGVCLWLVGAMAAFVAMSELLGIGMMMLLDLPPLFGDLFEDGGSVMALLGLHASIPFITGARFLAYIDNRTRRDGWDVQVRLMALAKSARRLEVG